MFNLNLLTICVLLFVLLFSGSCSNTYIEANMADTVNMADTANTADTANMTDTTDMADTANTTVLVVNGFTRSMLTNFIALLNGKFPVIEIKKEKDELSLSMLMNLITPAPEPLNPKFPVIVTVKDKNGDLHDEIINDLPEKTDFYFVKEDKPLNYEGSAFENEELEILLNKLGCKNIIIIGKKGDIVVESTILVALKLAYNVIYISDTSSSAINHIRILRKLEDEYVYTSTYGHYIGLRSHVFLKYQDWDIVSLSKKGKQYTETVEWEPFFDWLYNIFFTYVKIIVLTMFIGLAMIFIQVVASFIQVVASLFVPHRT